MQTSQNPSHSASVGSSLTPFEAPGQVASPVPPCSANVVARACTQVAGFEDLWHCDEFTPGIWRTFRDGFPGRIPESTPMGAILCVIMASAGATCFSRKVSVG